MVVVHHLNNSRSQRVLWLLEELGVPYEIVQYLRDSKTMLAPAELRKIHPLGKSPVVVDGAEVLAESGAILEYFVEKHGRFAPAEGTPEWRRYRYWMHYAEGSLMPPLLLKLVINRLGLLGRPARPFVNTQLKLHLDFLEGELSKGPWFLGETFSAADIMMSFPLEAARARAGLNETRPNLMDFLKRIHARGAYKRALEKGGAYVYAD